MEEKKIQKDNRNPFKKKVLRWFMFGFLAILFLEFVVYFGSNLFLADWARKKINEATQGVYLVEFNRVNFSLLRRGVFMDGIIMKPVSSERLNENQALFDLTLNEMAFRNLWYSFSDQVLYVGRIELDNPNVSLDLPEQDRSASSENRPIKTPVKALEEEIMKSFDRVDFSGIFIQEIEIEHADLFFLNFLSQNSLKAENTRLLVKEVDWTTRNWETPFNAKGFEFELENVSFPLPDNVHSISAGDVFISSLENIIDIKSFRLFADKGKESEAYYDVSLSELRVGNVDLNEAFLTSEVAIDEIILNQPEFKVERRSITVRDSTATGDLNELIQGVLNSFEVKELSINGGKFLTSDVEDSLKNRIEIEKLDFKMIQFYLGNDPERKVDQFFYGKDASMEIEEASLYFSDGIHIIYGDKISVSSFKNEIRVENVSVEPMEQALATLNPDNVIRISLPLLEFQNANLNQLYNDGRLVMDEMIIESPKVEVTEINKSEKQENQISAKRILEGYMNEVAIGKLDLKNGEVQFQNQAGERSNDIGFESFSLLLENVLVQANSSNTIKDMLLAEEMVLSLDKYRLKLRDNLHEFLADQILIDSKNSRILISNFTLKPENPDQITEALDTYGKSVVIDIQVPEFRIEGIDLQAAFLDQELFINQINVPSPVASLTRYRKRQMSSSQPTVDSSDEIKSLLTSYFSVINVDSVSFSDGKFEYSNYSGEKDLFLSEDSLTLNLKGFSLDTRREIDENRTFFSDEIDLSLRKYAFSVAGGDYEVDTDGLQFNSKSKTLQIDNLTLTPSATINSKIALSLSLPRVSFQGVDLESFLFDNKLDLEKLVVNNSTIDLEINRRLRDEDEIETEVSEIESRSLPRSIDEINIGEIDANDSRLTVNFGGEESEIRSIETGFNLTINGLNLDSAMNARQDISGLFEDFSLQLEDFSFALPDSIHTVRFSDFDVDNSAGETIFSDVRIEPNTISGNPGSPIFSGTIAEVGIQNNSIREMQSTGVIDLSQLRLLNPQLTVYLDSLEREVVEGKPKESTQNGLITSVLLQDILIENGGVVFHDKVTGLVPRLAFAGINLDLQDLDLDLMKGASSINSQLVLENDLALSIKDYEIFTKDSLSKLEIGKVSYQDGNIILDQFRFAPTLGRYEYSQKLGFQSDVMDANISQVVLEGFDLETYFESGSWRAEKMLVYGPNLEVFRDKRIPRKEGVTKPMPQELMVAAGLDLLIDSVLISNGRVVYKEFAEKAMLPGEVLFDNLEISIVPLALSKNREDFPFETMRVVTNGRLSGKGPMKLQADLFFEEDYPMDMKIEIENYDIRSANDIVNKGAFLNVTSGQIEKGIWSFRVNDDEAWGKMDLTYDDLKVEFLDTLTLDPGKGKLKLLTFFANTLIKNSNPRKLFGNKVKGQIYLKRDQSKFIFNTWWKTTLTGLKGSAGLGQPDMPKRRREELEED